MKDFYKSQIGKYLTVRTYSHTDHKQLLRVITRPIPSVLSADVFRQLEEKKCPDNQEVFIVKIVSENDAEINVSIARERGWKEGYDECLRRIKSGEIKT